MADLKAMALQITKLREKSSAMAKFSEPAAVKIDHQIQDIIDKFIAAGGDVRDFGDDPYWDHGIGPDGKPVDHYSPYG